MAVALLLAAGSGERLGSERAKALVMLAGQPMLYWSIEALRGVEAIERIVVALPEGEEAPAGTIGVAGGDVRSASVRAALGAGDGDPVIVHDAARPLAEPLLFERVLEELARGGCDGAIAATPVTDTIKSADDSRAVRETLERSSLWAVQTPQAFRRPALERALDVDEEVLAAATDDAWLVERAGGRVRLVEAAPENLKVTTPTDLQLAGLLLRQRRHLAVVRRIIESVNEGRMEAPFADYHDDVVWDVSRMQSTLGDADDIYRGHEGVRESWRNWLSAWETVQFEIERLFPIGDHVIQFQRQRMRGRHSGIDLELRDYAQVWTFRGDKIAAMRLFADREEAVRFAQEN
jgi:2-C-methyl-D-erythritol 4-phosphate cytidylyltransferase